MVEVSFPPVQPLVDGLRARGVTEIAVTSQPPWAIGCAPSGAFVQVVWWQAQQVWYVSRRRAGNEQNEPLGIFDELAVALACAGAA